MVLDTAPFMRTSTRGSHLGPGQMAWRPDTFVQSDQTNQSKLLADGAGHTFAPLVLPSYLINALRGSEAVLNQMGANVRGQTRPGINGEIIKALFIPDSRIATAFPDQAR